MGHMGCTNKNTTDWFNLSNYLLGNLYIHLNQHEYIRITTGNSTHYAHLLFYTIIITKKFTLSKGTKTWSTITYDNEVILLQMLFEVTSNTQQTSNDSVRDYLLLKNNGPSKDEYSQTSNACYKLRMGPTKWLFSWM